jgi:beta-galactosidase/beta-glucuronidase
MEHNCVFRNSRIFLLVSLLLMTIPLELSAQYKLNFGLRERQDSSELPKSSVPPVWPVVKKKIPAQTVLLPLEQGEWALQGGWELCEANRLVTASQSIFSSSFPTSNWYNATVPGTILTTLVDQGIYPDPYFGLNNLAIPDSLCRTDWWYRIAFSLPESGKSGKVWLLFNGINYRAAIWLNGTLIGNIAGAFRRGDFNVTSLINRDKENVLAVHIFPPNNPGIPHEESPRSGPGPNGGQLCLDGPTFISAEGWDWVPGIRDRNIGIWQDVRIRVTGDVVMKDPQVITDLALPDTTSARVTVRVGLQNTANVHRTVVITGKIGNQTFSKKIRLDAIQDQTFEFSPDEFPGLRFINPRLWWPNGYGRPQLYNLELSLADTNGIQYDFKRVRFGIRELSYELTVDAPGKQSWRVEYNPTSALKPGKPLFDNVNRREIGDGIAVPRLRDGAVPDLLTSIAETGTAPYLVIKVNGVPVFCRGGNWGMDDGMKRVSRAHLEPYFRLHRDAGFNMIRNWTGESTEEVFYELCDEYGLLVWNDFWLSTEGYNLDVNDNQLFLDNAKDVVRRFRNHPSLAVWCPRNEGYAPPDIEEALSQLIAQEDGTRHYQPNSRYLNLRPSGPWHYFTDPAVYFRVNAQGFNTEQGTPSVPTAASMRKMMAPEDLWPVRDVWYYHDLHNGQKEYLADIEKWYGPAHSLDEFCAKAQFVNYDSHRAMFEAWNSKMWNNTSGLLLWMTHPAWPSTVWQVYSWDYETFGSYFGSKKACEPLHVQMNQHDNQVVVINSKPNNIENIQVSLAYYDLKGIQLYRKSLTITANANQLTKCFTPDAVTGLPDVYLVRLVLASSQGTVISVNDYWKTSSHDVNYDIFNKLPKAQVILGSLQKVKNSMGHEYVVQLENKAQVPAIGIKLNIKDIKTGDLMLPAYFSDGYFNLLPGESRLIRLESPVDLSDDVQVVTDGYNIR